MEPNLGRGGCTESFQRLQSIQDFRRESCLGFSRKGEAKLYPRHHVSPPGSRSNRFGTRSFAYLVKFIAKFHLVHYLNSLDALNTSNQRIRDIITGKCKQEIPPTGTFIWTDVRDLALAHVKAIELPEAANKRFFITAGYFSNKEIADIIREAYPDLESKLPAKGTKGGDYPDGIYKYDNKRAIEVLGIKFRPLRESIVDTVKSLQAVGA